MKQVKNLTKRFCPQDIIVDRLRGYRQGKYTPMLQMNHTGNGYNWHYRNTLITDLVVKNFGEIHYLTEHAPEKIQKRWKQAKVRWHKRMRWHKAGINDRL